ncbi:hypothetical protein [Pseudomonas sp. TE24901]
MSSDIGHAGLKKMLPQLAQSARSGKLPLADGLSAAAVRFKALTPAGEDALNPQVITLKQTLAYRICSAVNKIAMSPSSISNK